MTASLLPHIDTPVKYGVTTEEVAELKAKLVLGLSVSSKPNELVVLPRPVVVTIT